MRISYPARVAYLDANWVLVDQNGRRQRASRILAPHLQTGDWVFVAAGSVIERISSLQAAAIVETLDASVAAEASAAVGADASMAATREAARASALVVERDHGPGSALRCRSARLAHGAARRHRRDQRCLHLR